MRKRTKGKEGRTLGDYAVKTTNKIVPAEIKPATIQECFNLLNRVVSQDMKQMLMDVSTSKYENHLDIGRWIYKQLNNNQQLQKQIKLRYTAAGNPVPSIDEMNSYILSRYRVYLKNN